jgi:hypothetical protein
VKVNLRSFERLSNIAKHDILRHFVEVVDYDGLEIDRMAVRPTFAHWLLNLAAKGIGTSGTKRLVFLNRFTEEELQAYHTKYCGFLAGQERFLEGDNAVKWLSVLLHSNPSPSSDC